MKVEKLIPILNVSSLVETFTWFEKLGWKKLWDYGEPPVFGAVGSGECEIFLCQECQGARGGAKPQFVGDDGTGGVWMSWFLDSPAEVDTAYDLAVKNGMEISMPPTNEPWGVREFHLHHPDGHTFRVGAGTGEE